MKPFLKADTPREQLIALLEWVADSTYLVSRDGSALKMNMIACTMRKVFQDGPETHFLGEVPVALTFGIFVPLLSMMSEKLEEFRSRDPQTFNPTDSWLKRAWPELDCNVANGELEDNEIAEFYYAKYLESSLARKIGIQWMLWQLVLWISVTLVREASAHYNGSPVPISSGIQLLGVIAPVVILFFIVKKCATTRVMWPYLIRGAWLTYSIWFGFATTMKDLKYLVAPLLLCVAMYILNANRIMLLAWMTYLIGLLFLVITAYIYSLIGEEQTWKVSLLAWYLYNTWIAIHLDIGLSRMVRGFTTDSVSVGKFEFMNWYMFCTGLFFHFLVLLMFISLFVLAILLVLICSIYCLVCLDHEAAKGPQKVTYVDDWTGQNRKKAQEELDRRVKEAQETLKNAPAKMRCLSSVKKQILLVMAFIISCIIFPCPCLISPSVPQPVPERFADISDLHLNLLRMAQIRIAITVKQEEYRQDRIRPVT